MELLLSGSTAFTLRQGIQKTTRDFEWESKLKVQCSALEQAVSPDF